MGEQHLLSKIPSLINGISKQSPTMRHLTQVENAENVNFSVVDGVSKRHGTETVLHFPDIDRTVGYRMHKIERDAEEEYALIVGVMTPGGGLLTPFNVNTGEVGVVTYEDDTDLYLGDDGGAASTRPRATSG